MKNYGKYKRSAQSSCTARKVGAVAVTMLLGVPTASQAVENGGIITPPGIFDFGSGITPPPTPYGALGIRSVVARAKVARDGEGNQSPVEPDLEINTLVFAYLKMTNADFLGGKYGFGLVIPTMDMKLGLTIPTPGGPITQSGSNRSVGDIQLLPAVVQWQLAPNLWTNAAIMIQAPTGSYNRNRLINTGVNHWTVQPSFNFTYISGKGLELSGSTQVNFNNKNGATDYRSGTELQQDFGIGQHFGHWTVGAGGYFYKQLTDDTGAGSVSGNRARVLAAGPAIGFTAPEMRLPIIYIHAYREFRARNRPEGYQLAVRASVAF